MVTYVTQLIAGSTAALPIGGQLIIDPVNGFSNVAGTWVHNTGNDRFYNSTNANADEVNFSVVVPTTGTYALAFYYYKDSNCGKVDVYVGATKVVSALDLYAGSASQFNISKTTGIAITAGTVTIRWVLNGKNASSSSYNSQFHAPMGMILTRTA